MDAVLCIFARTRSDIYSRSRAPRKLIQKLTTAAIESATMYIDCHWQFSYPRRRLLPENINSHAILTARDIYPGQQLLSWAAEESLEPSPVLDGQEHTSGHILEP